MKRLGWTGTPAVVVTAFLAVTAARSDPPKTPRPAARKIPRSAGRAVLFASMLNKIAARYYEPKRLRLVHTRPDRKAELALVEARFQGGEELEVIPPLVIYEQGEIYSKEAEAILQGRGLARPEARPGGIRCARRR